MVLFGGLLPIPSQLLLDVATLVGLAAGTWTLRLHPQRNTKTTNTKASEENGSTNNTKHKALACGVFADLVDRRAHESMDSHHCHGTTLDSSWSPETASSST